ncbi:MAG: SGNH/GDSL hydrolase family protein [Acidobacteria bacterium]|nr:SGNH/GDSL hydrolase family protein [Acidobacteriota bacterium]
MLLIVLRRALVIVLLALTLTAFIASTNHFASTNPPARKSTRVLFVGNSYTLYNDLPWITRQLSLSAHEQRPLETEVVAMMGATLQEHWSNGLALRKLKEDGPWDYVVLQEQSTMSLENPASMREYAVRFNEEIKKAGAKTILFVPWAHRESLEQQSAILAAYQSLAQDLGVLQAPIGAAWQDALPRDNRLTLYRADADSHPNARGSYLAACVLYATIYGKSPEGVSAEITDKGMVRHEFEPLNHSIKEEPFSLDLADARLLQQTAWRTVAGNK